MTKSYLLIKRIFDFSVAIFGFLMLWPLLIIIAIFVKFSSKGPIFFTQKRVTKNLKQFKIIKFRSMVENARKTQLEQKIPAEKLITKFGGFLRETHLDELPQLLNIFFGEMSVIGPRPLIAENEEKRIEKNPQRKKRYELNVGVSGIERLIDLMPDRKNKILEKLPQAEYLKNCTDSLDFDLYYVSNVSARVDLVLIFESVRLIFRKLKKNLLKK